MCPDKRKSKDEPRGDSKGNHLLQELDQLQSREKLPEIEPPAMIDQAVRNMARRAVHDPEHHPAKKQQLANSGKLRWIAGLATTSIAVIALGISLVQAPRAPEPAAPDFELKVDEGRLKTEETREVLQSAAPMRTEAAGKPANEADRSAGLELLKQAAKPMAAPETSSVNSPTRASRPPAMATLSEETFVDSADNQQQANKESAQTWLDLIQQLQDQGLAKEAAEQLRAFQQGYPEYPLPDWALRLQQEKQ